MSKLSDVHQGGRTQVQLPCAQLQLGLEHEPQPPMFGIGYRSVELEMRLRLGSIVFNLKVVAG